MNKFGMETTAHVSDTFCGTETTNESNLYLNTHPHTHTQSGKF